MFPGGAGAALLLKDGRLLGMHVEVAAALRERLKSKRTFSSLTENEESLDALVSHGLAQDIVAVLANVYAE